MTITLDEIFKIFTAFGAFLVVFLSVYNATQSASKNGFEQLERVVKALQETVTGQGNEIKELRRENHNLREWAETLVKQLEDAGIPPAEYKHRGYK
jgi:predicted transcriptional regulator YheO